MNTSHKWRPVRMTVLLLGLYMLQSCGQGVLAPLGPEEDEYDPTYTATGMPMPRPQSAPQWYEVAQKTLEPGKKIKIKGSRYSLEFDGDEITQPMMVTIMERDNGVVDVKLDPSGETVNAPATLEINYAGTANDPSSPNHKNTPLTVFERKGTKWIPVPGEPKAGNSKVRVMDITTLSRFAMMDGTGGQVRGIDKPGPSRPRDDVKMP